jgi:hypothetical protein
LCAVLPIRLLALLELFALLCVVLCGLGFTGFEGGEVGFGAGVGSGARGVFELHGCEALGEFGFGEFGLGERGVRTLAFVFVG